MVLKRILNRQQALVPSPTPAEIVAPEPGDYKLIEKWLARRTITTQRTYRQVALHFLGWLGKPLRATVRPDVDDYAETLTHLAPATQAKYLGAIKSLLTYGKDSGYLDFNVGIGVHMPKVPDKLAYRLMSDAQTQGIVYKEPNPRNHALLRLYYLTGARAGEIAHTEDYPESGLRWRDLQEQMGENSQVYYTMTVTGKGRKTRTLIVSEETWVLLLKLRETSDPNEPVFKSRLGLPLSYSQVYQIVRAAAQRVESLSGKNVSPHWIRHAHVKTAQNRGAKAYLIAQSMGWGSVAMLNRYAQAAPEEGSSQFIPL